ncbi:MAG: heavy-metal-associated domain-containing protein [Burkholderiaceae bacterium]
MIEFQVNDMTCGHCVGTITAALNSAVPAAKVSIDLPSHSVRVDGAADAGLVERTIREAGYTPQVKSR